MGDLKSSDQQWSYEFESHRGYQFDHRAKDKYKNIFSFMVKCVYCGREFKNVHSYSMHKCEGYLKEKEEQKKARKEKEESYMYVCECGKRFETANSLKVHARFCDKYISKKKPSKYKDGLIYRCECGREFDNYQSFNAHLSHCKIHHEVNNTPMKLRPSEVNHSMCWENKSEEELIEIHAKSGKTYSYNQKTGKTKNTWIGRKHTEISKQHHREGAIRYRETIIPGCRTGYNKIACKYIDMLNEKYDWNLQHAENGGEVIVGGFFLDGYDKEHNIAFEYDEKNHYEDVHNNILKQRDIDRQNYIIHLLGCEFYRYNEKTDTLYKVN